LHND